MSNSIKMRGLLVLFFIVLSLVSLGPTFMKDSLPQWWQKAFDPIHLGLDLQGGMHLVLGVEVEKAVESRMDSVVDQLESQLRDKDIIYKRVERVNGDQLAVIVYDDASSAAVNALVADQFPTLVPMPDSRNGNYLQKNYHFSAKEIASIKDYAVRQALETMRNRIDQFGVSEPVMQRQSDNRILIQLPGVKNPQRAIDLLGKTARLEFNMVVEDADIQQALQGNLPPGTKLLYEKRTDPRSHAVTEVPLVVYEKAAITGDLLSDAQVRIDTRFNEPYVAIEFNSVGAQRFEQVTAASVGKRMAIVLDDTIYSAPVIRERIGGGRAQISGSFTSQEATDLAIILRAGSLPAPVKILEDRTVGPSLGQDSINEGIKSVIIGAVLVVLLMLVYYRGAGLVANVALALNLLFMMAMLTMFKATLTLPGLAGIVLTVGMAVDANVLIFERIREELHLGRTPRVAVDSGFSKAFITIVDANITTLIAALVLFQFGTGPVKGFAVTLSIGILASMFTAIFVSRLIFDIYFAGRQVKKLSI